MGALGGLGGLGGLGAIIFDGVYFYDTFTDSDSTTLPNHTPNTDIAASGWTDVVAGITIESNKASDNDGSYISTCNPGLSDVILEADMVIQGGGSGFNGFVFRFQDSTHFIVAGMDVSLNKVTIWENNGGVWAERSGNGNGSGPSLAAGQSRTLKITVSGTSISVEVDGVEEATATLSIFQTETEHGLYNDAATGGTDATWDNFKISKV